QRAREQLRQIARARHQHRLVVERALHARALLALELLRQRDRQLRALQQTARQRILSELQDRVGHAWPRLEKMPSRYAGPAAASPTQVSEPRTYSPTSRGRINGRVNLTSKLSSACTSPPHRFLCSPSQARASVPKPCRITSWKPEARA